MLNKSSIAFIAALVAFPAAAEIVVIGHPSASALTGEQVKDAYMGKNKSYTLIDLPESSAMRADFYRKATDRELPQIKSIWSRITFSGAGAPPKEMGDATAVKKAVAADPKTIGYIDKAAVDGTVKVLASLP